MFLISNDSKIRLTNDAFDIWTFVIRLVIPVTGVLCFVMSLIWDLPRTDEALGILAVIAFIMGWILTVSDKRRTKDSTAYDGQILVEGSMHTLILYKGPEILSTQKSVSFKVNHGEIPVVELGPEDEDISQA